MRKSKKKSKIKLKSVKNTSKKQNSIKNKKLKSRNKYISKSKKKKLKRNYKLKGGSDELKLELIKRFYKFYDYKYIFKNNKYNELNNSIITDFYRNTNDSQENSLKNIFKELFSKIKKSIFFKNNLFYSYFDVEKNEDSVHFYSKEEKDYDDEDFNIYIIIKNDYKINEIFNSIIDKLKNTGLEYIEFTIYIKFKMIILFNKIIKKKITKSLFFKQEAINFNLSDILILHTT